MTTPETAAPDAGSLASFHPVRAKADLDTLDHNEIVQGYMEFRRDDPPPGPNRGRAYWHGWQNAAMDHNVVPIDEAARQLAHEVAPRGAFRG